MTEDATDGPPEPLEPCRKKVNRKWTKKALGVFVGACGTAAAATVVSVAVNRMAPAAEPVPVPGGLRAERVTLRGDVATTRISGTQPATSPAITTQAVSTPGELVSTRISTTQPDQPAAAANVTTMPTGRLGRIAGNRIAVPQTQPAK